MLVLDKSGTPSLINQTLEVSRARLGSSIDTISFSSQISAFPPLQTMLSFLSWIPIGYVFETNLVVVLVTKVRPFLHSKPLQSRL